MSAEGRREQILDVTHAVVLAEGFHAATPRRIADEAGINRSLIYQQFGDPAGLFVALIDRESARAADQFASTLASLGDMETEGSALERVFDGVLAAVDAHPGTWRLFLFPPEGAPPELHSRLAQSQARVLQFLIGELLKITPDLADVEYTARVLQAAGRELLQLRLEDPQNATADRLRTFVHQSSSLFRRRQRNPVP